MHCPLKQYFPSAQVLFWHFGLFLGVDCALTVDAGLSFGAGDVGAGVDALSVAAELAFRAGDSEAGIWFAFAVDAGLSFGASFGVAVIGVAFAVFADFVFFAFGEGAEGDAASGDAFISRFAFDC